MPIQRRQVLQSAALLPLMVTIPGIVHAQQVGPLSVGVYRNLIATTQWVGSPQNRDFDVAMAYLQTNRARGVFIDIVPEPTNDGHAGICFNASPRQSDGAWQPIYTRKPEYLIEETANQYLWFNGVGVIFQGDGRIMTEQWITDSAGRPAATNLEVIGQPYPKNTVLRVTATTDLATGQTILAVYALNSSGAVVAQLANATLTAAPIGDRAGVFVFGGGNIQVQPFAIYP